MSVRAQPSIFVQNAVFARPSSRTAFSYIGSFLPAVAPGSLIAVAFLPLRPLENSNPTIHDPATVTVTITPSGCACAGLKAEILEVEDVQVIARVPPEFPISTADVTLAFDGQTSAVAEVNVVPSSFALYTSYGYGHGQALAQITALDGSTVSNQFTRPVRPGDFVTLWGTGLGTSTMNDVTVLLGGHPSRVTYAGHSPEYPGLDQINFQAPDDPAIPDGCYVALWVEVRGTPGNFVSISKGTGSGPCLSPFGFTPDQIANLDAGFPEFLGQVSIGSTLGPPRQSDGTIGVGFVRAEFASANFRSQSPQSLPTEPLLADDAYFGCGIADAGSVGTVIYEPLSEVTFLQVGDGITLMDPSKSLALPYRFGTYSMGIPPSAAASLPDDVAPTFFTPGAWVASAPGSATVLPFKASINLPPPIQVTNYEQLISVDGQRAQTVTWDPSGYSADDVVTVRLNRSRSLACVAPAQAGQVSIPRELMMELDAAAPSQNDSANMEISLTRRGGKVDIFRIALINGASVPSLFSYESTESFPVSIR
jgi:uncharacterized protein (TIGR03437 family)